MKKLLRSVCAALCALGVLLSAQLSAFAADYEDGTYTVPFSMSGLGRHNIAWQTATVEIEDGNFFVTFTLERVDPRDHAPQYDWLASSLGSVTPVINDEAFTCTFRRLPVPSLGAVEVSAQTSAMSQPYAIDYTINISDEGIPLKAEEMPEITPEPTPEDASEPAPEQTPEAADAPSEPVSAEPSAEAAAAPAEAQPAGDSPAAEEAPAKPSPTPEIESAGTVEQAETEAAVSAEPETDEPAASEAPVPEPANTPATADVEPAEEVNTNVGALVAILAAIVAAAAALITAISKKGKGK